MPASFACNPMFPNPSSLLYCLAYRLASALLCNFKFPKNVPTMHVSYPA